MDQPKVPLLDEMVNERGKYDFEAADVQFVQWKREDRFFIASGGAPSFANANAQTIVWHKEVFRDGRWVVDGEPVTLKVDERLVIVEKPAK